MCQECSQLCHMFLMAESLNAKYPTVLLASPESGWEACTHSLIACWHTAAALLTNKMQSGGRWLHVLGQLGWGLYVVYMALGEHRYYLRMAWSGILWTAMLRECR